MKQRACTSGTAISDKEEMEAKPGSRRPRLMTRAGFLGILSRRLDSLRSDKCSRKAAWKAQRVNRCGLLIGCNPALLKLNSQASCGCPGRPELPLNSNLTLSRPNLSPETSLSVGQVWLNRTNTLLRPSAVRVDGKPILRPISFSHVQARRSRVSADSLRSVAGNHANNWVIFISSQVAGTITE